MSNKIITEGTVIQIGKYPFGDNGEVAPLKWLVLDTDEDKGALVVSLNCIDSKKFNEVYEPTNWQECSLRKWLNEDFYNKAFSQIEKQQITLATIDNINLEPGDYEYINADECYGSTDDYVFLLSIAEYQFYLSDSEIKMRATPYAIKKGAYCTETNNCGWWLRTPAFDNPYMIRYVRYGNNRWYDRPSYNKKDHITFVYLGEYSREDGNYTDCTGYGVCPAMWLSLKDLENFIDVNV